MNQTIIPKDCTSCGNELDANGKFCKECGASIESMAITIPLPVELFCPNCAQHIGANDKFCRFCALDFIKSREEIQIHPETRAQQQELPPTPLIRTQNIPQQIPPIPSSFVPNAQTQQQKYSDSLWSEPLSSTTNLTAGQSENATDNPASFISPSGAALAVICFFLPWMKVSQCGITKTVSGSEIAIADASFWLFPLMGIISIAAYFVAKGQKQLWKAKPFIIISSGFALFLLFYKYYSIPSAPEILGQRITAADLGITLGFGGYGAVIGFILAIIGCAFMSHQINGVLPTENSQKFSDALPIVFESASGKLKPNVAAMLCYVLPPLLMVVGAFSGSGVLLLLSIISFIAFQVFLLNAEPYKKNPLIRLHDYQSIFMVAGFFLGNFLLVGFLISISGGMSFLNPSFWSNLQLIGLIQLALNFAYLGLCIFMAVKSYQNQMYQLPYIGDWAMRRARTIADENVIGITHTAAPAATISQPKQPTFTEPPTIIPESLADSTEKIYFQSQAIENSDFAPIKATETVATQKPRMDSFTILEDSSKETKDYFFLYIIGGVLISFFLITGAVVRFIQYVNENQPSINTNQTSSYTPSNTIYANTSINNSSLRWSNVTNSYQSTSNTIETPTPKTPASPSFSSSLVGREGKLTLNANLRSASNKNASSIGIHFQGARVRILNVEYYDTVDGPSTWYKVKIVEYGCDANGNLGCGKNSDGDADEGWVNAKVVRLD